MKLQRKILALRATATRARMDADRLEQVADYINFVGKGVFIDMVEKSLAAEIGDIQARDNVVAFVVQTLHNALA